MSTAALGNHLLFDLLAWACAAGCGVAVYRWRLAEVYRPFLDRLGAGWFAALLAGSLLGAFGFGTLNLALGDAPALSRSVLGALAGAVAGVEIYKRARGLRGSTGVVFAAPLLAGIAVGRIGCFRAGLGDRTHGIPTVAPWGVDLGDGIARHPVQLYESAAAFAGLALLLALLARRSPLALACGFYLAVAWYAGQRFVLEFLKPYPAVLGPFNVFHLLCAALFAYALLMIRSHRDVRA